MKIIVVEGKRQLADAQMEISAKNIEFPQADSSAVKLPAELIKLNLTTASLLKGMYRYTLAGLDLSIAHNIVNASIDTVRIQPLYSKQAFNSRLKFQSDRIVAALNGIKLKDISYEMLVNQQLHGEMVSVKNLSAFIYRDRRCRERRKSNRFLQEC